MNRPHSCITFDNDENQGLVFNFNYKQGLSKYCPNLITKSYNNSTSPPKNLPYSNAATVRLIKALGVNGQYETLASLVRNSEEVFQESKHAYPKWRHTGNTVQSIYVQKALSKRANAHRRNQYAITMRFSPILAQKIMDNGIGFIQSRLALQLKRSLGYTPDMWLHLEAVVSEKPDKNNIYKIDGKGSVSRSRGVLHMHGAIAFNEQDLGMVKRVVRSLNNSASNVFQNHELHLTLIHDALGWVDYCHKHRLINNMLLDGIERYTRTKALGSEAQKLYEIDRKKHKAAHGTTYGKEKL